MEKMKKSIRLTSAIGCKYWVIHPIMPFGLEDNGTELAKNTWDMNIEFMTELVKTAKEYNVVICLENMPMLDFSLSTPEDILRFVRTIYDDNFKICLDTGHVSAFNNLNLADEVRRLGKEIKVMHIHDTKQSRDLHLMPYFGRTDWDDFAKALGEVGYEGVFSLETAPASRLPDYIYEPMCKLLFDIAKEVAMKIVR